MIWNADKPISHWTAGSIQLEETLYQLETPTIFTALVGLSLFFFFKKDELEESDIYLTAQTSTKEVELLKAGRVSVRGLLSYRQVWIIEADFDLRVLGFQESYFDLLERLLPPAGVGLRSQFGIVPDSVEQAEAFIAFKFTGQAMSPSSMSLSVFKDLVDGVSNLVRHALLPNALSRGRNSRFFDVQIGQPRFASLIITITSPDIDQQGLSEYRGTKNLSPQALLQDSQKKGLEFWNSIEETSALAKQGELTQEISGQYHNLLDQVVGILPSEENTLENLQVTFFDNKTPRLLNIDKKTGDRLLRAQQIGKSVVRTVEGVIVEVNAEAHTFIVKSPNGRLTTCAPTPKIFEAMNKNLVMTIGEQLQLSGTLWKRARRDYLAMDKYPGAPADVAGEKVS